MSLLDVIDLNKIWTLNSMWQLTKQIFWAICESENKKKTKNMIEYDGS